MKIAIVLLALVVAFFAGAWWGSQPRTCAALDTAYGPTVLCSNDYKEEIER